MCIVIVSCSSRYLTTCAYAIFCDTNLQSCGQYQRSTGSILKWQPNKHGDFEADPASTTYSISRGQRLPNPLLHTDLPSVPVRRTLLTQIQLSLSTKYCMYMRTYVRLGPVGLLAARDAVQSGRAAPRAGGCLTGSIPIHQRERGPGDFSRPKSLLLLVGHRPVPKAQCKGSTREPFARSRVDGRCRLNFLLDA